MRTELPLPSSTANKPERSQGPSCRCGSLPQLLALVPGLHAGDEGVALVPAVVLVGVIQGHTHALVLVPLIPHVPSLNGVLDPLLFHAKAARSTPALGRKRGKWLQPTKAETGAFTLT